MSAPPMEPFDIRAPLPSGTTLLEASAGTGKTWAIGALVARYVAEGHLRLDQMLVITFTRAASQELRARVREQLVELERALADPGAPRDPNAVVDLLVEGSAAERAERQQRVRAALASFDEATIATTHEFCSLVLRSLGVAGDSDATARLVEDLDELTTEVVDDLYLRSMTPDHVPPFSHEEALDIARSVVSDPQARIEPADAETADTANADAGATGEGGVPAEATRRVRLALAVRRELDRRKRAAGVLSYDDLLSQLAEALRDEHGAARVRMRQRWQVVLVDEFQDTDPVQWQVLDRAFTGHATMVLIGDPKQAIYGFRGGDVITYLQAAGTATTRQTLGVNWRSDAGLLTGLQRLLEGAELGDPQITVHPVRAHHDTARLLGAPHPAPFRLRVVDRAHVGNRGKAPLRIGPVREHIGLDAARDIHTLLTSGATFDGRPLVPGDVAVLAHTNKHLRQVQQALREVGVPSVLAGSGSVFATPAATEWLTLLEALEQPHRGNRVRAAALTTFLGMAAVDLDEGGEHLTNTLAARLRAWSELYDQRGVAAVLEAATIDGLAERVLGLSGGERTLTDLRQVGQLLHEVAARDRLGLVALTQWLREQTAEDHPETGSSLTRRLDSDAAAVQLVTIHSSKGLQFPVVYCPFLADRHVRPVSGRTIPRYHDTDGQRAVDVGGGQWPGRDERLARERTEDAGESLRLLYVAMTRAQSQVVTWWMPATNTKDSALHRLLFGRDPEAAEVSDRVGVPADAQAAETLAHWRSDGGPVIEPADPAELGAGTIASGDIALAVREFGRGVDTAWRRTSYTALSRPLDPANAPPTGVSSEPETTPKQDEQLTLVPPVGDLGLLDLTMPSPMADLPSSAAFGSLVHQVLELADPRADDLDSELRARLDEALLDWPVELDRQVLVNALRHVLASPLGPLADGLSLGQIPLNDRLVELAFEFPLAGGDLPPGSSDDAASAQPVVLGDLADLLRRHLPDGDPLLPYADLLDQVPALAEQTLRGYLTGSIDVALRVGTRYLVVDYKTNWLGPHDEPLTAHSYRPEALAAAMGHSDYPLQALLYAVVLHRFLRWRQPGYDPEQHLGGVLYLYLRGMCGPDTPVIDGHPCGVFSWRPQVALVQELSDLLDGRVSV